MKNKASNLVLDIAKTVAFSDYRPEKLPDKGNTNSDSINELIMALTSSC